MNSWIHGYTITDNIDKALEMIPNAPVSKWWLQMDCFTYYFASQSQLKTPYVKEFLILVCRKYIYLFTKLFVRGPNNPAEGYILLSA